MYMRAFVNRSSTRASASKRAVELVISPETNTAGTVTTGAVLKTVSLSSEKNKSWTMIITMPDGNSCLMAAGENWETIKTVAKLGPGA